MIGAIPTMIGFFYTLAALNFPQWVPLPRFHQFPLLLYSLLPVMLAMSIFLSRRFAKVNHSLSRRLVEVETLSAANMAQEVERARLEAENERKNKELEEARELQLSLLPKKMPEIPGYSLAAYMQTAAEVGGDYYDFQHHSNEETTVAVGDATGHGVKAGTMVVATKSLFDAHGHQEHPGHVLASTNQGLKRFRFRNMFMAMCLARFRDDQILLSFAGMPPALIFREKTGVVDERGLKSLPLGVTANQHFEEMAVRLDHGDILVLMSDGLMERFDTSNAMFGMDRIKDLIAKNGHQSPDQLIATLTEAGEAWGGTRPNDDDITLMVLKREA